MSEIVNVALNIVGTLIGAFVGAWAAFRLEGRRNQQQMEDENVVAGNLALLALSEIWNALHQYQKDIVGNWRERPDAWLNFPAANLDYREVTFDSKALSFLLDNHPAQVQRLLLEKRRFDLAVRTVDEHSRLALKEIFPTLSTAGVGLNEGRPEADIRGILGVGLVHQLEVITAAIIRNVDEDVVSSCRRLPSSEPH